MIFKSREKAYLKSPEYIKDYVVLKHHGVYSDEMIKRMLLNMWKTSYGMSDIYKIIKNDIDTLFKK